MKIAIASDHAGYELKEALKAHIESRADVLDLGAHSTDSVDYPEFGKAMGITMSGDDAPDYGILVCGSGIGISIAANRFPAVRAALCVTPEMAQLARQHNNANVVALGARLTDVETAKTIVDTFLKTDFEGGRHERRVAML
jgi:ribose 5-phosphate isomerase B